MEKTTIDDIHAHLAVSCISYLDNKANWQDVYEASYILNEAIKQYIETGGNAVEESKSTLTITPTCETCRFDEDCSTRARYNDNWQMTCIRHEKK